MIGQIIIYIAIAGVVGYLAYLALKKIIHRRKAKPGETSATGTVLARIYNVDNRSTKNEYLTKEVVNRIKKACGGIGRQWNFEGKWVYAFRLAGAKYEPVENYLDETRANPPSDVHEAINQPEITLTHDVRPSSNLMERYGWLIPWTIGIAFLIFMMVAS